MQGLKKFWNNWQWVLALGALLYGIFLFYYQSNVSTPEKIQVCQQQLFNHLVESKEHFEKIDDRLAGLDVSYAGIMAQLNAIKEDTAATKGLLFELLGKRL